MNNSQDLVKIYKISFTYLRQLYLVSFTFPIFIFFIVLTHVIHSIACTRVQEIILHRLNYV